MTAMPHPPAPLPMTAAEYAELPEDVETRFELEEGNLVMSPRPIPDHQICLSKLCIQMGPQIPYGYEICPDVDVDLHLVDPDQPGTVRAPDLVVVTVAGLERVRRDGGLLRASDLLLAVEILSPSSRRIDTRIKRDEYADAGIPYYWTIDLRGGVTLTAHHLAGEFGYVADPPVTGEFTTEHPFPVRLDLDRLV